MYGSVIVGVDATDRAACVARTGAFLSTWFACPLTLVHVSDDRAEPTWLTSLAASLDLPRIDVVCLEGRPGEALSTYQASRPDSLLCIGTAGHGVVAETLFGSTALEVLAQTRLPVLLSGPHAPALTTIARMVACVDTTDDRVALVRLAAQWAFHFDATLDLVEVGDPAAGEGGSGGDMRALARCAAGGLGLRIEWDVLHDDRPGHAYAGRATIGGPALLFTGHPSGVASSTFRDTLHLAPCPVVVGRRGSADTA